jgi:hypothetical protein
LETNKERFPGVVIGGINTEAASSLLLRELLGLHARAGGGAAGWPCCQPSAVTVVHAAGGATCRLLCWEAMPPVPTARVGAGPESNAGDTHAAGDSAPSARDAGERAGEREPGEFMEPNTETDALRDGDGCPFQYA